MIAERSIPSTEGRLVVCSYSGLLLSVTGLLLYAAGILFTQSAFAGRWVVIWLALGWLVALVVLRSRVTRLERRLVEIRSIEMQPMRGSE
jgi:hypothetical protein